MEYCSRIRRARTVRKLAQAHVGLSVGVHRSAVAQWEQLQGTIPGVANLAKIPILSNSFEWLATGRGRMKLDAAFETGERTPSDFARGELEEPILLASRNPNQRKREAVLALMEALAR